MDGKRPAVHMTRGYTVASLAVLLLSAAWTYWPGLAGGFVFDDFANLPALGRYGGVHDWASLTWYTTSGIADPTGRPVSMLSFLIDARDWPADPWPFKRTNLVLHLINGTLLYSLLVSLGITTGMPPRLARSAALLGTALWLLHPLWVSTVLYVVQRHAMLATFFVLCGLRTWVASRQAFAEDRRLRGWLLSLCAVPVFGLLAGLSKANGFLLPVLIVALQVSLLPPRSTMTIASAQAARGSELVLAWIPAVCVIAGIALQGVGAWSTTEEFRGWSLGDRLLTQPRALMEYLQALFMPGLATRGIFADDFQASIGLITPWPTLPALIGALALLLGAVVSRRRRPAFSAAVLFFFAAHAMESTVIPLELYFEHRNYLPALLLGWSVSLWALRQRHGRLIVTGLCLFAAMCGALTYVQASLWGKPEALARSWAATYPASVRAQTYAAATEMRSGRVEAAVARLTPLADSRPDEPQYLLLLLEARCEAGTASHRDIAAAAHAVRGQGIALDYTYQWLSRQLLHRTPSACLPLDKGLVDPLLRIALSGAQKTAELQARAAYLRGLEALRSGECSAARHAFEARLAAQRRPEFAQTQVGLLATHCDARLALEHLDDFAQSSAPEYPPPNFALRQRDRLMMKDGYWSAEFMRLRRVLQTTISPHHVED